MAGRNIFAPGEGRFRAIRKASAAQSSERPRAILHSLAGCGFKQPAQFERELKQGTGFAAGGFARGM